jgi:hypothetical protein
MGKLGLWERITLNAVFGGILVGEECQTAGEKAIWLHDIVADPKLSFRRDEVVREIQETRAEDVYQALGSLVDKGLVLQVSKNTYRVSAAGAAAIAAEENCVAEFEAMGTEIGLPLAA